MTREKHLYLVTIFGGIVNVVLLIFKFAAGILGHSAAMIADAVHSFSDFATDVIVLVSVKMGSAPSDKEHPYGHGKFETLATTVTGIILFVVAGGILYHGIEKVMSFLHGETLESPGLIAFWAAVVSIVLKEFTFQVTVRAGRKWESQAVQANAWHHRSDALSSIGTALGIGGAVLLGEKWSVLDPVASIIVSVFIFRAALPLVKDGLSELLEHSLPDEINEEILSIASSFPDVSAPHGLRTRRVGNSYVIEMHILMDGNMTLFASHECATAIEDALRKRFGPATHVTVHVEPADSPAARE